MTSHMSLPYSLVTCSQSDLKHSLMLMLALGCNKDGRYFSWVRSWCIFMSFLYRSLQVHDLMDLSKSSDMLSPLNAPSRMTLSMHGIVRLVKSASNLQNDMVKRLHVGQLETSLDSVWEVVSSTIFSKKIAMLPLSFLRWFVDFLCI